MKQSKILLIVFSIICLGMSNNPKEDDCNCETKAKKEVALMTKGDYSAVLIIFIDSYLELYKVQKSTLNAIGNKNNVLKV